MSDIYGPIKKARVSILFFVVPALAISGISIWLMLEDTASVAAAINSPPVLICLLMSAALLIWGAVFISTPVVTLTPKAIVWPNGRTLDWAKIAKVQAGQDTTMVASPNVSTRKVVHEVVRLFEQNETVTTIVTTWAAIGPDAANKRIEMAFAHSRPDRP